MTAEELRLVLNESCEINGRWPATYEVDAETYANCCQHAFDNPRIFDSIGPNYKRVAVAIGKVANGLMFKNVELILKK